MIRHIREERGASMKLQNKDAVWGFIADHGLNPDAIQMDRETASFLTEMERGLAGKDESSLAMLPTYINLEHAIPVNRPVVVIDAGGTNFRVGIVSFNERLEPEIRSFRKRSMPGFEREVSAGEFFEAMAEFVAPVIGESDRIGFCFSYAAEITANRDGRLLFFSKEIKAPEVCGMEVGANLLEALGAEKAGHICNLTVLNDTVATLLAARAAAAQRDYSGFVGFILGTGTNTCYLEKIRNIGKLGSVDREHSMLVNVESGNYRYSGSELDRQFYATTKAPKMYRFEKLISGAYIGPYAAMVIGKAVEAGLFSPRFAESFAAVPAIDTIVMDQFLHAPGDRTGTLAACCETEGDATALYILLDSIIERAGKLTAINLSAAVLKADIGHNPLHPVCINADGTTFHKTHNLRRYTEFYLDAYLTRECGRYYEIISIDNAPVLGAAIAGLTN